MLMVASHRSDPVLGGLDGIVPDLEGFYKDIHAHPELSMQEERTSAKAAERLETAGFEVTRGVGKTGVVGLLGSERLESVDAVLLGTVAVCSGLIGWHEFRANPAEETTYGQGRAKAAFYATTFWIALFLSFYFVPVAYFDP